MQPRWVPVVVSLLTCALLAGSAYARVERPGQPPVTQVVESARGTGLTLLQGLTFVFGALMLESLGDAAADTRA